MCHSWAILQLSIAIEIILLKLIWMTRLVSIITYILCGVLFLGLLSSIDNFIEISSKVTLGLLLLLMTLNCIRFMLFLFNFWIYELGSMYFENLQINPWRFDYIWFLRNSWLSSIRRVAIVAFLVLNCLTALIIVNILSIFLCGRASQRPIIKA